MIFSILTSSNSARDKFILIVAYALAAMFAIVIHEYSHARVAVKCGDLTPKLAGRLTLNPMAHFDVFGLVLFFLIGFGWAKPVPINPDNFGHKKRDTIFTSLAGIFANLLTAAVFFWRFVSYQPYPGGRRLRVGFRRGFVFSRCIFPDIRDNSQLLADAFQHTSRFPA